jgi:hypothetical protein
MSDTTGNRYKLQKSLFALEEDFWVENEQGEQLYKADSQALSLRETFVLADKNGNELLQIEAKLLAARPTMKIKKQGQLYATVTKKLLTLLHQHYDIQVEGGPTFDDGSHGGDDLVRRGVLEQISGGSRAEGFENPSTVGEGRQHHHLHLRMGGG